MFNKKELQIVRCLINQQIVYLLWTRNRAFNSPVSKHYKDKIKRKEITSQISELKELRAKL